MGNRNGGCRRGGIGRGTNDDMDMYFGPPGTAVSVLALGLNVSASFNAPRRHRHLRRRRVYSTQAGYSHPRRIVLNPPDKRAMKNGTLVPQFWMAVADHCCERSVSLEDWRGVNLTEELRRVRAGLNTNNLDDYVHVGNVMLVDSGRTDEFLRPFRRL